MRHPLLLIACFLTFHIAAIAGSKVEELKQFPSYKTVVNSFFKDYLFQVNDTIKLHFCRKPAGWYISETYYLSEDSILREEPYWLFSDKIFRPLSFTKNKGKKQNTDPFFDRMLLYYYARAPYYGYSRWMEDVVTHFDPIKDLSDTLLEGLARAHAMMAREIINPEFDNVSVKYRKKFNTVDEQVKAYLIHATAEIELYRKIAAISPWYETFVGRVDLIVANTVANRHLQLWLMGKDSEREEEYYSPTLYPELYVNMAKNYLMACEKNGILFTNGDNDSFPLLYVQEVLGYRKDVSILNLSLLNLAAYAQKVLTEPKTSPPLRSILTASAYNKLEFSYCNKDNNKSDDLKTELLNLISGDTAYRVKISDGKFYPYLNGHSFTFFPNTDAVKENCRQSTSTVKKRTLPLTFTTDKYYFLRSELLMMDIISSNIETRPIYFACTVGNDAFLGMENHMITRGMVYNITPFTKFYPKKLISSRPLPCDFQKGCDLVLNQYQFRGNPADTSYNAQLFYTTYNIVITTIADALIINKKRKEALQVLDHGRTLGLFTKHIVDRSLYEYVRHYYELKEFEKGNECARQLMENYLFINNHPSRNPVPDRDWELNQSAEEMNKLIQLSAEYKQEKIREEAYSTLLQGYIKRQD